MANTTNDATKNIADSAAQSADQAITATQRATNSALDSLSSTVNRAAEQASALAHRSLESAREGTQKIRSQVQNASDSTVGYIKDEPFKAVLIAAATGAALMALVSLLARSRRSDY